MADSLNAVDEFVRRYEAAPITERQDLVDSFIGTQRERGGFPVIEGESGAVFVYVSAGGEESVRLVGSFKARNFYNAYWDEVGEEMQPITNSARVYFKRMRFEPDARHDYLFVVDGKEVLDPLNPRRVPSGPKPGASELAMPQFQQPEEIVPRAKTPGGKIAILDEEWAKPTVRVYLPAAYDSSIDYPVVYTADGSAWMDFMSLPTVLDNLIADGRIRPLIAVMIDSAKDRDTWYFYNPDYLEYLGKVVRYVDRNYSTERHPGGRLHIGTSAGGRATLYTGLERPDLFHNLAIFSASLVGPAHFYESYFSGSKRPDPNLRFWLSAGTYEGYIYEDTRTLENYLERMGQAVEAVYTHGGHSFGTWRHLTDDMLLHFFPRED